MSVKNKLVFDCLCKSAEAHADLPWHEPETPELLVRSARTEDYWFRKALHP
ncbi:MAG: hypothetical protein P8Y61_00205 [Gammaproteobacteria bacterium]|jgi:hypothetical protein